MTKTERSHIISKKDVPISQGYTPVINFTLFYVNSQIKLPTSATLFCLFFTD